MSILKSMLLATAFMAIAPAPAAAAPTETPIVMAVESTDEASPALDVEARQQAQIAQMTKFFGEIFGTEPPAPVDPARLALGEQLAAQLLADGTLARAMDAMFDGLVAPIARHGGNLSPGQISGATGVWLDPSGEPDEARLAAITELLDPYRQQRDEQRVALVKPFIARMMTSFEPAMRGGLARAYARHFDAAELSAINAFFATPAGRSFARESLVAQADPEVLKAMLLALPEAMTRMFSETKSIDAAMKTLPKQRQLSDLSDAELAQLAGLLSVPVETLTDYRDAMNAGNDDAMITDAAMDAAAAADAAAESAAAEAIPGDAPWFDPANWDQADQDEVDTLNGQVANAQAAAYAAEDKAVENARRRYEAAGHKPPPTGD